MPEGTSISRTGAGNVPSVPFSAIKGGILGKKYELSIAFVSLKKSRELNRIYRGKDNPTNVLSFPLSPSAGEIVFSLETIRKEAKDGQKTGGRGLSRWLGFLAIHGMLHLKGHKHGKKMEALEKKFEVKYLSRT